MVLTSRSLTLNFGSEAAAGSEGVALTILKRRPLTLVLESEAAAGGRRPALTASPPLPRVRPWVEWAAAGGKRPAHLVLPSCSLMLGFGPEAAASTGAGARGPTPPPACARLRVGGIGGQRGAGAHGAFPLHALFWPWVEWAAAGDKRPAYTAPSRRTLTFDFVSEALAGREGPAHTVLSRCSLMFDLGSNRQQRAASDRRPRHPRRFLKFDLGLTGQQQAAHALALPRVSGQRRATSGRSNARRTAWLTASTLLQRERRARPSTTAHTDYACCGAAQRWAASRRRRATTGPSTCPSWPPRNDNAGAQLVDLLYWLFI